MSVPLDRLYNFLDSINRHNGHDAIIYRFWPHGSRKIQDLVRLKNYPWKDRMIIPAIFYHDQEPLNFEYYENNQDNFDYNAMILRQCKYHENHQPDLTGIVQFKFCSGNSLFTFNNYALLCHSEKNSKNLLKYENSGYVGVYWWAHAVIARDWFRVAEHDLDLIPNFDKIAHDFLVYNRAWTGTREYRLTLAEMIVDQNLVNHCKMTFSSTDNGQHYLDHVFDNPDLKIKRKDLDKIYPLNTADSTASADYCSQDYAACGIEIVLETLFDDDRHHLTEKSLRPIACGRPFILAAAPGSLGYLQSYGFETFAGLIDETYDSIVDPIERLQAITKEMQRIADLDRESKHQLWKNLYNIADRNKNKFFSTQWHDSIIEEYYINFESAIKLAENNRSGKRWRWVIDLSNSIPELKNAMDKDSSLRTAEEVKFVTQCLEKFPN
jgi:hypothetical protein